MSKTIKIGDKVRFVDRKAHKQTPEYYPSVGTIGTVVRDECNPKDWKIQWPKGTTSGDDRWYCEEKSIELFDGKIEKDEMTNEEIWEMLKPKMDKNRLTSNIYSCTKVDDNGFPCFFLEEAYKNKDVHNAIAIAYRSGYERAMKGRPFKISEKKKKGGHWEPVDPNNLPKEGTKVRYSRFCEHHLAIPVANKVLSINSMGTVLYKYKKFGVEVDNSWYCCSRHPERFDMWVEDDE